MSKVVKKIGKGVKKVFKGVKKVFKKVIKSKIFKIALAGVAIYFGGVALGMWGGAGGTGAAASAQAGIHAATGAGAGAGVSTGVAAGTGIHAATGAAGAAGATGVVGAALPTVAQTVAPAATQAGVHTATGIAGGAAKTGFLAKTAAGAKTIGSFIEAHPIASSIALNTVAGAFSPDQIDIMREQESLIAEREERDRKQRERNQSVGGIDLGFTPSGAQLTTTSGENVYGPGGIINRNL